MIDTPLGFLVILLAVAAASMASYFSYPFFEQFFRSKIAGYLEWVTTTRERMFQPIKKSRATIIILFCTLLWGLFGYFLSRGFGFVTVVFTLLFAWVGWSLLRWWIAFEWYRRIRKFDEQLVDALNLMANSLKSGLNLPHVIQVLVSEMPKPISQEFGLVLSQQKLGLTLDEALEKMLERIPSHDLAVAVHSILILRETGGDLSETFETIASTIRERRKVDGRIKAFTTQGKTQGLLLFLMPFALGVLLYTVNPDFILPLVTTQLGWMLIAVMLFFQVIGGLWIKKIVTIDV